MEILMTQFEAGALNDAVGLVAYTPSLWGKQLRRYQTRFPAHTRPARSTNDQNLQSHPR
jgi:hypothetical protein